MSMMSPRRRDLFQRVMDGDPRTLTILHIFDGFARCEEMLNWLIQHGYTGQKFFAWVKIYHEGSPLGAGKEILMRLNKDQEASPVIFGKDFLG